MKKKTQKIAIISAIAASLIIGTAATAAYITKEQVTTKDETVTVKPQKAARIQQNAPLQAQQQPQQQPQQQLPRCDDNNIVGLAAGAVLGGVAGNQIGKGNGKTAATIGGTLGGAMLGQRYIPTNGVACRN